MVVQLFDPANPSVLFPASGPGLTTRVFAPGTYFFDIPTLMGGVIGTQPRNLKLLVTVEGPLGAVGSMDSIGIFTYSLVPATSATPTPTVTMTATVSPEPRFTYFEDFIGSPAGAQPLGWRDATNGILPPAEINFTSVNSYAAVTVTNSGGFGSVESTTITADVSVYTQIQWKVINLQQGASLVVQLFDPANPSVLYPASSPTMATRVFSA
jgi:hypothetical protein